ncbi:FecR domain-containing protein [bacterium]|nr:FecR domain-containing protein [bacterium]
MTKLLKISLLLALLFLPQLLIPKDAKDVALIFKSKGVVAVKKKVTQKWQRARRGIRLDSGDKIRTGENSLAAIVFTDDKSLMKIRSRSSVRIQGKREGKSISKRIFMALGNAWFKIKRQRSEFRLETPTGVAAVKGTEFYTIVDEDGNMTVFAVEGIIELINKYGSVLLRQGEKGYSDGKTPPTSEQTGQTPQWGHEDEAPKAGELEIEYEDANGVKKTLRIEYEKNSQ